MAVQLPAILSAILTEHRRLRRLIQAYQIDLVISDSRFGCFSKKAHCIFISHQIHIKTPLATLGFHKLVNSINHWFIQRFDACWVPDFEDPEASLSGSLSRPAPFPLQYIGPLSRIQPLKRSSKYDLIVVLSGPEPQRTRLEALVISQLKDLKMRMLLVKGKPAEKEPERKLGNLKILPFLGARALNEAMAESDLVICRSGYSTIMDLAVLGTSAILIPTPGQTEQEYLAQYFYEKKIFYTQEQGALDLPLALTKVKEYSGLCLGNRPNLALPLANFV